MPWRITAPQFLHHFRISKPRRNVAPFVQSLAQFRAGDIQNPRALWNFVRRNITVLIFQVHHHLEGNHRNAHFRFMFLEKLLGIIGPIERFAIRVLSGTCMIAAHDEVCATVIFSNQPVPYCFARATHAHRERQHGKLDRPLWILCEQQLIATRADVVVDVSWLCHSHRRMNQQVCFDLLGCAHRQFNVRTMHGIPRLKCNNIAPAKARKISAHFRRGKSQCAKVVMRGPL